jgi:hypothetical protein
MGQFTAQRLEQSRLFLFFSWSSFATIPFDKTSHPESSPGCHGDQPAVQNKGSTTGLESRIDRLQPASAPPPGPDHRKFQPPAWKQKTAHSPEHSAWLSGLYDLARSAFNKDIQAPATKLVIWTVVYGWRCPRRRRMFLRRRNF